MAAADPPHSDLIVGIDLGTTNSLIAICDERGPRIIPDHNNRALLPSVVRFIPAGGGLHETIVGHEARDHAVEFPTRTVYSIKRLMGRGLADIQQDLGRLPYEVIAGENDTVRVQIDDRAYTPQEISAIILAKLKHQAEAALNRNISKAVITVPAYFDDAQRQATRDAGRLAGLDVVRIVNEPTAAALAYGIGQLTRQSEIIAVYDLGGGTFDISILQVTPTQNESQSSENFFQVLATAGDTHLGGDDVDQLLVDQFIHEIRNRFSSTLRFPPQTLQALRLLAEATKIKLSTQESAQIAIDLGDNRTYTRTITRKQLEELMQPWVQRTIASCERALKDAQLNPSQIDRIVLVGGSTRIPLVREAVHQFFQREPYTALDPDQVVALGAAVQASILAGLNKEMLLLDVIPLSLGIETVGGAVAKLIVRNTTVPARATEMFSTSVDGQTNVRIHVLQGERELVADCRSLGQFDLRNIPPMPAGIPQIQVDFLVDSNGILSVSAVERRSGKRASIQVVPRHGLTRDEVDRIERESFTHAKQDMHAHRLIDLAVNAALDIKWIRDAMQRVGNDLDPNYRIQLEASIATLQHFIDQSRTDPARTDANAFHQAKESLDKLSMKLHEQAIVQSLRE